MFYVYLTLIKISLLLHRLLKMGFKVIFEFIWCLTKTTKGKYMFRVKMRSKQHALNLIDL